MKSMWTSLVVAVVVFSTGCTDKGSSGGPGATSKKDTGTHIGQSENSFKLSPPMLATRLKQGEAKQADISIKRGKNFDQDVALKFADLPQGVSIDPSSPTIKHGSDEAKVTIKAADDAAVGDFTVKITGHPKEGPDAVSELKVTVSKK